MSPDDPLAACRDVWRGLATNDVALRRLRLSGREPMLPSSFAVGSAAQASLAVASVAALQIGQARNGLEQDVAVDMREAALECCAYFRLDGAVPQVWDKIAGLYPCGPGGSGGWVRLHTNFAHHRDGALRLLGLPPGPDATREQVASALVAWTAESFEDAAARAGLVVAALRTLEQWDQHAQGIAIASLPLVELTRIGDAPALAWPGLARADRPLTGLRVLDLTRILAGPACSRTLAAYGADVMLVNSPHLPNIEAIADLSRGKRSALADLRDDGDRLAFDAALAQAHVLLQSYRPGSLAALGWGPDDAARARPGIVYASLSAYGRVGPWSERRGFDSLVQTATGFNDAEGRAAGGGVPKALPMQILDMGSGFLLAWGIEMALLRQRESGGSWHVQVSLARTAQWLRSLGRVPGGFAAPPADFSAQLETSDSGFGRLEALRHAARFSVTPARYVRPSVRPGSDPLAWT